MKHPKPRIHPNACKKLVRYFRQVKRETGTWNIRETARRLGVNQKYVHDNLLHGLEPTDATESGRETRARIFLKAYRSKARRPRESKPHPAALTAEWWSELRKRAVRSMVRQTNNKVVRRKQ